MKKAIIIFLLMSITSSLLITGFHTNKNCNLYLDSKPSVAVTTLSESNLKDKNFNFNNAKYIVFVRDCIHSASQEVDLSTNTVNKFYSWHQHSYNDGSNSTLDFITSNKPIKVQIWPESVSRELIPVNTLKNKMYTRITSGSAFKASVHSLDFDRSKIGGIFADCANSVLNGSSAYIASNWDKQFMINLNYPATSSQWPIWRQVNY